jgi:hypothetical protein
VSPRKFVGASRGCKDDCEDYGPDAIVEEAFSADHRLQVARQIRSLQNAKDSDRISLALLAAKTGEAS